MAATGILTTTGNTSGGPDGARSLTVLATTQAAVGETLPVALIIGSVTVTVPTGVTMAVILPPNNVSPTPNPSYSGAILLKNVAGDSGTPISNKTHSLLTWDLATAPASFVLTATAVGTATVWFQ